MTEPTRPTRRSEEIRRRRQQQSHATQAAQRSPAVKGTASVKGGLEHRSTAGATSTARQPSLLDRLKTDRRPPVVSNQLPVRNRVRSTAVKGTASANGAAAVKGTATTRTAHSAASANGTTGRVTGRRTHDRNRLRQETVAPPVMRRGRPAATSTTLPSKRARGGGRRVYNVPLNRQGAEMRLPSLPRPRIGWRVLSFLLLAIVAAALYWVWSSPVYTVEAAQIHGLQRLTSGEVNRELALTGQPVFAVDAGEIQKTLREGFPEISSAQVQVELPNTVMITVTERVPSLIWRQNDQAYLVDDQGMIYPTRGEIVESSLPMIEASANPPYLSRPKETGNQEIRLVDSFLGGKEHSSSRSSEEDRAEEQATDEQTTAAPAGQLMSPEMVSAILQMWDQAPDGAILMYEPAHGFGWQDRRGWMVTFGSYEDMTFKLQIYRAILEHLKSSGERPALISIEHLQAPYYRLEPSR